MKNNNSKILGIDYGRSKIGVALAEGSLAEPLAVIRYKEMGELIKRIKIEIDKNDIEKIVIGISEGKMAKETGEFGKRLGKEISIPIETFDETLSSQDAQAFSREAGINRKKRREMEDAYAAAIILQNYLDCEG